MKRYRMDLESAGMELDDNGRWVEFTDVIEILEQQREILSGGGDGPE